MNDLQNENRPENLIINYVDDIIHAGDILHIDDTDLSSEFAQQAAVYGWISTLVSTAEYDLATAKHKLTQLEAEADEYWRRDLLKDKPKITEKMVFTAVTLDDTVIAGKDAVNSAQYEFNTLRAIRDALKMRGDMLVSMGAHARHESNMIGMHTNDQSTNAKAAITKSRQV